MRRRRLLQAFAVAPAAAAAAQSSAASPPASEGQTSLRPASIEGAAVGVPGFFTPSQWQALTKLSDAIVSATATRPAASQAGVPEFLDFLIGQSPAPVQNLYREGLDRLAREGINDASLAPLRQAWTYVGPTDRFAQFLQLAKSDIIQATTSSREWASSLGRGSRGSTPAGYYWRSLD